MEKSCERTRDVIIGNLVRFAAVIIDVFNSWRWSHFNLKWPLISLKKIPLSESLYLKSARSIWALPK